MNLQKEVINRTDHRPHYSVSTVRWLWYFSLSCVYHILYLERAIISLPKLSKQRSFSFPSPISNLSFT